MEKLLKIINQILVLNFLILLVGLVYATEKEKTSFINAQKIPEVSGVNSQKPGLSRVTSTSVPTPAISNPVSIPQPTEAINQPPTTNNPQPNQDLSSQLILHNNPSDCWIYLNGHYYDITGYFGKHPGGDTALTSYCGKDATNAFATKDKNPPSPHSANAELLLGEFLIQ